ncbi:MAG TPA: zinc ribbon domain-containing protein [Patescibacteria group bacterium]|nr:zinc ribbon domain-containing protein [Patescibacteria group bacterium]
METEVLSCPFCHYPTIDAFYYCPNCGKNLKAVSVSISVLKQIGIYSISILLPPLGLWPGIKYLRQSSEKAKTVGLIAIILTIISFAVTIWLTMGLINQINQSFMEQANSFNQFQNLGF